MDFWAPALGQLSWQKTMIKVKSLENLKLNFMAMSDRNDQHHTYAQCIIMKNPVTSISPTAPKENPISKSIKSLLLQGKLPPPFLLRKLLPLTSDLLGSDNVDERLGQVKRVDFQDPFLLTHPAEHSLQCSSLLLVCDISIHDALISLLPNPLLSSHELRDHV
jgi:hypothetical protein